MVLKTLLRRRNQPADEAPPGMYKVMTAADLLNGHRQLLQEIRQLAGVTDRVWDTYYGPAYRAYALLVQLLPASEAHHHSEPGGLLRHGLEVSLEGLRLRQGHLLPPGASPEEMSARQDVWTYCCAMAGLLHDIGKPIIDLEVVLHNGRVWSMLAGPMLPGTSGPTYYRYRFRPGRAHRSHERTTALVANHVVPELGLEWIASDQEALLAWVSVLHGHLDEAGPLGAIASRADQTSVARDLACGIPIPATGSRARPLAEVLVRGLRELLRSGALPINRPGAAAYLVDGDLWLVSKRVLDELREFLTQDGQGVPARNDRLMDELQQHGLLVTNGDRAIWRCEIRQGDWESTLTCLRMPASLIWPDEDDAPESFEGTVTPSDEPAEGDEQAAAAGASPANEESQTADSGGVPSAPLVLADPLPEPPLPVEETGGNDGDTRSEHHTSSTPAPDSPVSGQEDGNVGKRFLAWLTDRINNGAAKINSVDARIHVVPEGMVIVTPAIFRDYDPVNWRSVQRHFQRLQLHRKLPDDTNIWTCEVKIDKERKRSELKAYLIPDPEQKLGISLPRPNRAVHLVETCPLPEEAGEKEEELGDG
ncbi:MAG TPA: hypothetical protein ENK62_06690 [Chromatiales bacterium]|nr:hypothetical protein [Chromatiales bacterium]